ncbi:MAG: TonB-dependent receptor [Kangiellaceae bacterium]
MSKTIKQNPLARAVKLALIASSSITAFSAPAVFAAEDEASDEQKITITGSRIKRTDVEGALPVTVISREDIDASGQVAISEVLRNTTFNSFGSFRTVSGSSGQSQANISLRGLGSNRSLILVDGRRAVSSPVLGGGNVDLNSIPAALVERVEILQDGASAVYGSDAIGGVINIITRKDFEGAQISVSAGRPTQEGGDEEAGSILIGTAGQKGNISAGISWESREGIFQRDRWYTAGDWGETGDFADTYNVSAWGNSIWSFLGSVPDYTAAPGCDALETNYPDFYRELTHPRSPGSTVCAYNFANIAMQNGAIDSKSIFVNGNYEISNDHNFFSKFTYTQTQGFGRYAPALGFVGPFVGEGVNDAWGTDYATLPGFTEFEYSYLGHRMAGNGPRDNTNTNHVTDFTIGLEGVLGDSVDYEVYVQSGRYLFDSVGYNYGLESTLRTAIANGDYDWTDPFVNTTTDLDGDGVSDAAEHSITIGRQGESKVDAISATFSMDAFEMGGGSAQVAFGGDYRESFYADIYDQQSEAGAVIGSAGNSAAGDREQWSVFGELSMPFTEELEVSIAGRFDDYSDQNVDGAFTGKASVRYQPMDELVLRASFGSGFRAPTLSDLFSAVSTGNPRVADITSCRAAAGFTPANSDSWDEAAVLAVDQACLADQIPVSSGGNPDLEAEESDQYSAGVAWAPMDDFSMSLDYYNIQLTKAIAGISATTILDRESRGQPLPSGTSVSRAPNGGLLGVVAVQANISEFDTEGLDLNIRYGLDMDSVRFDTNLQIGYVLDFSQFGDNFVGTQGLPESRANWTNSIAFDDHRVTLLTSYIDSTSMNGSLDLVGHVASYTTHDLQYSVSLPWDSELRIGVRNLLDRDPSLNRDVELRNYDTGLYSEQGRTPYIRYTINL